MTAFKSVCGFVFFAVFSFCDAAIQAQEQDGAGLLHATGLNADAVKQFDVLIRHEVLRDVAADDIQKTVRLLRLRFDWEEGRFLGLSRVDREIVSPESDKPKRKFFATGFVSDGDKCFVTRFPASPKRADMSLRGTLYNQTIPDLRLVGIAPFPRTFVTEGTAGDFESWLKSIAGTNSFERIESVNSDRIVFQKTLASMSNSNNELIRTWEFQLKSLMPARAEAKTRKKKNGKVEVAQDYWEEYEWEEKEGIYVPVSIVGDRRTSSLPFKYRGMTNRERYDRREELRREGVDYIPHLEETSVKLHWFSVSEPFDDEDFSLKYLQSVDALHEQTDPFASGANSIVE